MKLVNRIIRLGFWLCVAVFSINASAAEDTIEGFKIFEPEIINRYQRMHEEAYSGAKFDPALGGLTFSVTDIDLPGNFDLPVSLTRWIPSDDLQTGGPVGWQWNIPVIKARTMKGKNTGHGSANINAEGWYVGENCTGTHMDTVVISNREKSHGIYPWDYWGGILLHIPDKVTEKFLEPPEGSNFRYVTKSNYVVTSCIEGNEQGFIVKGPDGTRYTFNHLRSYDSGSTLSTRLWVPARRYTKLLMVTRVEDRFGNYVTYHYNENDDLEAIEASDGRRVEIRYEPYDTTNVFGAVTRQRAIESEANGKVWAYEHNLDDGEVGYIDFMDRVRLPDGRYWQYSNGIYKLGYDPDKYLKTQYVPWEQDGRSTYIGNCALKSPAEGTFPIVVRTPSGLNIEYEMQYIYHGRSGVDPSEVVDILKSIHYAKNLNCDFSPSVISKTIVGKGIQKESWAYHYSENTGTYIAGSRFNDYLEGESELTMSTPMPPVVSASPVDYRSVKQVGPEGTRIYYVDRKFQSPTEGMVIAEDDLQYANSGLLRRVEYTYAKEHFVGADWLGSLLDTSVVPSLPLTRPARDSINLIQTKYRINKRNTKLTLFHSDGTDIYENKESEYDDLGFSALRIESNNFSFRERYTRYGYHHDQDAWVLGLPTTTELSDDGQNYVTKQEISYHGLATTKYQGWYLPYQVENYGLWTRRFPDYHTESTQADAVGRLKRIELNAKLRDTDGEETPGYRYQEHLDYKRGMAQRIIVPHRYSESLQVSFARTVDDDGLVTSLTDMNGVTADYGYDNMRRLRYVDLPQPWSDILIGWDYSSASSIRRSAVRCMLNTSRTACQSGTEKKEKLSELDSLYRVLLEGEIDLAGGVGRYGNLAYNTSGQQIFVSDTSYSQSETDGVHNKYDALGRLTKATFQDGSYISREYLSGNRVKQTDAEAHVTTIQYLAYGAPETGVALAVNSPEGVSTSLDINLLGDIRSITQSGPGKDGIGTVSITEYRAYDAGHYLCKVSRPDVGTTVYGNNALGEVVWQASGVAPGATDSCEAGGAIAATRKSDFTLDNLGAPWKVDYGDSSPDIVYSRDNNGNVLRQELGNQGGILVQDFGYNTLGLPDYEQSTLDGEVLWVGYQYDTLGRIAQTIYPDSDVIDFQPNAFGEPTHVRRLARSGRQAYTYADRIQYYPGGQLESFSYGNGLAHSQLLDRRKRPENVKDSLSDLTALHMGYQYDDNSNVTRLTDHVNSTFSLTNLSYDGLDRLTSVSGNSGAGNSLIKYDGLGNITYYKSRNSVLDYHYGSQGLLESVDGSGSQGKNYNFSYDARGNITGNGFHNFAYNLAGHMISGNDNSYIYDGANRRVKSVRASGTEYSFYTQSGQLLHRRSDEGMVNYIYLGKKLIAKDGNIGDKRPRQHFKPFGNSLEGEIDDIGYTGHKFDKDIGLSYMQARYYDPVIGRFYSNDPVDYLGHVQRGNPVHGFGRYTYANNNPYKYTDPDGELPVLAIFAGAAAVGAIANVASYALDTAKSGGSFSLSDAGKAAGIGAATGLGTAAAVLSGSAVVAVGGTIAAGGAGSAATQLAIDGNIDVGETAVSAAANLIGAGTGKIASEILETTVTTITTKTATSASGREFTVELSKTTFEKTASGEVVAELIGGSTATTVAKVACGTIKLCE